MLIPTTQNIKTITQMREDALGLIKAVENLGMIYLFQRSNPKAVILSLKEFQRLYELVEDHLDEIEAYKLSKEKRGKGIPITQIKSRA